MSASIRKLKARAISLRQQQESNWFSHDDTKMYFIRHIKPCATYSSWCGNCNAVRFRETFKRFPLSLAEFDTWVDAIEAQAGETL